MVGMERKKMQLSVKRMFILFALFAAAVIGGGCGGGDVAPARPTAHVNGVLHGELADAIYRNINIISSEEDTSDASGDMLMLSSQQFDGSAAAELAAPALEEGRIVVLEHVNQDEINEFISALDGEQKELPILSSSDDPDAEDTASVAELFAMERRGGHNFYYVMLNDDNPAEFSEEAKTEYEYEIEGPEDDPTAVIQTEFDIVPEEPELTPAEEALLHDSRVADFVAWAQSGPSRLAALQSSGGAEGAMDDLKELAAADVWDYNASYDRQTFTIRYTVYSCHSFDHNKDYYLVSQSAQLNPSVKWKKQGGHVSWPTIYTAKQEGQMRTYKLANNWIYQQEQGGAVIPAKLVKSSPENANGSTSVTSGFSWNMGGSLGFSGLGGTGSLSGGVSFSESQSFSISDCTVENNSSDDGKAGHAEWIYRMADPSNGETHFYYSDLNDAPLLARSNFQPVNRWIWEVDRKGDKTQFQSEFIWTNGKSEGQVNCAWIKTEAAKHNNWETRRVSFFVPLKMPPLTVVDKSELEFKKNGETQTVKLVSASEWQASSNAEWCEVTEKSGGATGSSGVTLHITAAPNDGGANRETTVTIKAEDGSTCTIKVFQSQY